MTAGGRSQWLGRTPRLVLIASIVGAGAGLGAVVLISAIAWVTAGVQALGKVLSVGQWSLVVILPVAIWFSRLLTARFSPEVAGHGVPQILAAIAVRGGRIRRRVGPLKTVATALTIGSGGSAGREGSIAQIGAALGSSLARLARLPEDDVIALVAAGAGAGISATFNAPIAGMFFAMEVILREISIRNLHTVVIASVSGAVVSHSILGDDLTFAVPGHRFDDPRQIVVYAAFGLVAAGFGWLFLGLLDWFEVHPVPLPDWARPLLFGSAVAVLGLFWPEVLGTGQEFVNVLLRGGAGLAWWALGILAVAKAVATSATLGGRGSGGIFMPSLFIGASAGAGFAQLIAPLWRISPVSSGAFALVGMAATFSAVARAPLTSILIVFEITGDYGLVLPLMVATIVSTPVAARLRPESAYMSPLTRMGIHPAQREVTDLLRTIRVADTMSGTPPSVGPDTPLSEARQLMIANHLRGLPVVSGDRLVGIVSESDLTADPAAPETGVVHDVMTRNPVTVSPAATIADALERLAALGVGHLPIVTDEDDRRLVGFFSRDDVVAAYHQALGAHGPQSSELAVASTRDDETGFYDIVIPAKSQLDGRRVKDIRWPETSLVVSIERGQQTIVPSGDTMILAGDSIMLFGRSATIAPSLQRLLADDPTGSGRSGRHRFDR